MHVEMPSTYAFRIAISFDRQYMMSRSAYYSQSSFHPIACPLCTNELIEFHRSKRETFGNHHDRQKIRRLQWQA
jgi:hypothetical protein